MIVKNNFDGGVIRTYEINESEITFDLRPGGSVLYVMVDEVPQNLKISLLLDEKSSRTLKQQGIFISLDGISFSPLDFEQTGDEKYTAIINNNANRVWVSTAYPYGRDELDKLLCDTYNSTNVKVKLLKGDNRIVPVFEFGEDDGRKRVHYILAGEDCKETAGCYVADAMIRLLCTDKELSNKILENYIIKIIPILSPYSATQSAGSYTDSFGNSIYGAATWSDSIPPAEFNMIRNEITELIKSKRLALFLAVHSWRALHDFSQMEIIRSAGVNEIIGERLIEAEKALQTLVENVPSCKSKVAEKVWHLGLARDYLLRNHNFVSFRIEITTKNFGLEEFNETGKQLLLGLSEIKDWSFTYNVCDPYPIK